MTVERYPYQATAWLGDVQLARSDGCLWHDELGQPAELFFPVADIDFSSLKTDGASGHHPRYGETVSWSGSGPGQQGLLAVIVAPPNPSIVLKDHGTFDPGCVRIEVVDRAPGVEPRDVNVKSFPTWGDATHLIEVMDVQPTGSLRFTGLARTDGYRPVVEGSQMLGQAIVAALRHAPNRRVVSAHMAFLRAADAARPLLIQLEELSAGRSFTGLAARALQDERFCAAGTVLLRSAAPDLIRHAVDPPDVPGPYECVPLDMGVTGRDIRVREAAYASGPDAPVGPPQIDAWVRFRQVPDDEAIHVGLMAQFTGHMSIAAALRPHAGIGQSEAHRALSMGINAISLSVHGEIRADQWLLYRHLSTSAGDGMTHSECRVHDEHGQLMASFSVDAMVRSFPQEVQTPDARMAM
ncbi:MAG TPA: acyl-CoA thioesterase domain-containing protein [Acidimicrobiales bacterium]